MFRLDDDIAVVTGSFGHLGPIWLEALLQAGARVAALDLPNAQPSDRFQSLSEKISNEQLLYIECDITDRNSIELARKEVVKKLGPPSVLVNNAGIDQPPDVPLARHRIEELPVELFREMIDVNLIGTFQVMQTIGGLMAERGHGSIINIGSLYASVSPDQRFYNHLPGDPPFLKVPSYGASKAAVVSITKYFSTLWGSRGVRVNTLSPGGVLGKQDDTFKRKYGDRVPLGRMAASDDLMGPLVFLASSASSYVTGIDLRVDGGFTAW